MISDFTINLGIYPVQASFQGKADCLFARRILQILMSAQPQRPHQVFPREVADAGRPNRSIRVLAIDAMIARAQQQTMGEKKDRCCGPSLCVL